VKFKKIVLSVFSPDVSEKPFEVELPIFPEKKERPAEAPFFILEKSNCMKKLETVSRK
jgi:hypothetical protein